MAWSAPTRKSRDGEVRPAPEKVHGTALADESRAKFFEDSVRLHEDAPETVRVFRVVRSMTFILIERGGVGDLVGLGPDAHAKVELLHLRHEPGVKRRDRPWL